MRKIFAVAAIAAVAACSPAEGEAEPEAVEEVAEAEEEAGGIAADGNPTPGNYRVTLSNGDVVMEEVREDGTYSATNADGSVETGTWEQKSPEIYCTTEDEEGAEQDCNEEMINEEGVWISRDEGSEEYAIVERVEG